MFALAINRRFWLPNASTFAWSIKNVLTFGHSSTFCGCFFVEPTSTCKHECNSSTKFSTMDAHDSCLHAFQQTSNGVVRRNVELRWQQKAWSFLRAFWRQRLWTPQTGSTLKLHESWHQCCVFYLDVVLFWMVGTTCTTTKLSKMVVF